jgi:hypothetical protein
MMQWKNGRIFTSKTLSGNGFGLEEIDDGIWSAYHGPVLLAHSAADEVPCLRPDGGVS